MFIVDLRAELGIRAWSSTPVIMQNALAEVGIDPNKVTGFNTRPGVIYLLSAKDSTLEVTKERSFKTSPTISQCQTSTATRVRVWQTGGSLLATASFVGNKATLASNLILTSGVNYTIEADNSGGAFNSKYSTTGYPVTSNSFIWVSGSQTQIPDGWFANIANLSYYELGLTSATQTWNLTISTGSIKWNVQACDSDGYCGFANSNYTVSLDNTAPTIILLSGNGSLGYGTFASNQTITYFVNDTNLDKCWINYNGTNRTDACVNAVPRSYNFTLVPNLYNATIFANDTLGNVRSYPFNWSYKVFEKHCLF
jgi:hypothetical protein